MCSPISRVSLFLYSYSYCCCCCYYSVFYEELSVFIVATSSSPILSQILPIMLSSPQLYENSSCQIHWQPSCCQDWQSYLGSHYLTQLVTPSLLKQFLCIALSSPLLFILLAISRNVPSPCPLLYKALLIFLISSCWNALGLSPGNSSLSGGPS